MRKMMLALVAAMVLPATAQAATKVGEYSFGGMFMITNSDGGITETKQVGTLAIAYDTITKAYSLDDFALQINGTDFSTSNVLFEAKASTFHIGGAFAGLLAPTGDTDDFRIIFRIGEDAGLTDVATFSYSFNGSTNDMGNYATTAFVFGEMQTVETGGNTPPSGGPNPDPGPGAVPEPSTWALMLAGFGAVGVALRRRTRRLGQALAA